MNRVFKLCAAIVIGIIAFFVVATFGTGIYLDMTDPRPEAGTPACETAQEAIFKREPDHGKTPVEFMEEVNDACKP